MKPRTKLRPVFTTDPKRKKSSMYALCNPREVKPTTEEIVSPVAIINPTIFNFR